MQNGRARSPVQNIDNSTSTSTSVDPNVQTSPNGGTVATRRNSWHRSRDSYYQDSQSITQPTVEHPLQDEHSTPRPPFQPIFPPGVQARPRYMSQASLDSQASAAVTDGEDQVHLTTAPGSGASRWRSDSEASILPQGQRLSRPPGHYGETSPRRRTLGTLKSVSRNIRRASMRVVNLAGITLEDKPIRLQDDTSDEGDQAQAQSNPEDALPSLSRERLRGRTLGLFGPQSVVRRGMLALLLWRWTEPSILLLILTNAIVLIIQAHRSVFITPREDGFFKSWEDYVLFVLFIIFTLEAFARILVTGLILDPETRMTDYQLFYRRLVAAPSRVQSRFEWGSTATVDTATMRHAVAGGSAADENGHAYPPSQGSGPYGTHALDRTTNSSWVGSRIGLDHHPFQLAIEKQQSLSERNLPYLRHSWNRIDFVAVVSFWIMFSLAITGAEIAPSRHIYIFRAMSVLRVSRLLAVTTGTTTIMRSLKIAGPLLARVAVFVLFAMVMFSIIGVQSFKGSFRRTCQLIVDDGSGNIDLGQSCGGQIDRVTLNETGYFDLDGNIASKPKGFICPVGQICQESDQNPYSNMESYDDIFAGALQVLIVAGANGWTPTMYQMMDADFYAASIFFVVCIVILNFWLINLFVAVITNTFASIRAETKKSAFGAGESAPMIDEKSEDWVANAAKRHGPRSAIYKWYMSTQIVWVALVVVDVVVQAFRTADSPHSKLLILQRAEQIATLLFDIEMAWRIAGYLPDWRAFGERKSNYLDLFLAVVTSIIQIPLIAKSAVYPWLTIFQLLRFYRFILALPTMRPLLLRVFGNMGGLINMTVFLLITNVLGALIAVQLFRGDVPQVPQVPQNTNMNFSETYITFLAMYQVFSSENWTNVLWLVAVSSAEFKQAIIAVLFFAAWFLFANFIMLQMFIAVINENFEVAEEQKRKEQFDAWVRRAEPHTTRVNFVEKWNPYRFVKANPKSVAVESMPSGLVLPLRKAIVQDGRVRRPGYNDAGMDDFGEQQSGFVASVRRFFDLDDNSENVPMAQLRSMRRESSAVQQPEKEKEKEAEQEKEKDEIEMDYLDYLAAPMPDPLFDETRDALYEERARKADFIEAHPTYDKTLWFLSNQNPVRRFCQKLVNPANGERIFGTPPSVIAMPLFQLLIFVSIVGGTIVAAHATPMYRRDWYQTHQGDHHYMWFDIADITFACILIVEFLIKIIADGFMFTPNAYLLSVWNAIDFVILLALLVNMLSTIAVAGGVSRVTRALKAFRALRLITFFPWMRETFDSVLFSGARSLFRAALLALLYMIPYAIWGLNLFAGYMFTCNDTSASILTKSDCVNEFINQPQSFNGTSLVGFLAPRSWARPSPSTTFSFDNFFSSLLILFEIVSLEGWIDVMSFAMDLIAKDEQPQLNSQQINSIFFLTYNLLGAVIILTLFVSIIIGNFSTRSGMALLTEEQKRWIDLQKLIKRQQPSKRPKMKPKGAWRAWCFDRAVHKNGWWARCMTGLYIVHILALMTQTYSSSKTLNQARDILFLVLSTIYLIDVVVRATGLGLRSFRANGWNIFDVVVVAGGFATTIPIVLGSQAFAADQLQKLFLVCIAFKLVQKNNGLNQLFKTSISSLPSIAKLLMAWGTLFVFFALVATEVFGLTRWESAETHNQNYRTFWNSVIMLSFMTVGEGWNQYMHDFTVSYPQCTNSSLADADSDCGSTGWAYVFFIAWNLLSMYIFVNMFTGVVVENFSFVFQLNNSRNSINRQEMRAFKKVWAQFDVDGTGYLARASIVPFLGKLSGVFEVRIYPMEYTVPRLLKECKAKIEEPRTMYSSPVVADIDIRKLGEVVDGINHRAIATRRKVYNRLYQEAIISVEPGKGISFTNMLLLLAHYKIINDDDALRLDEILNRRNKTDMVTDRVNYDRVRSLLKMITCRRRYMALKEERMAALRAENSDIPAIIVDDDIPRTPTHRSWDITSAPRDSIGFRLDDDSPAPSSPIRPIPSPEPSMYIHSQPTSPMYEARPRHSDVSAMSGDFSRSFDPRRESIALGDKTPQQILSTLQNSVWGEMMHEAHEDE